MSTRVQVGIAVVAILALATVASALRAERDSSSDLIPGFNPNSNGRRMPMQKAAKQTSNGFRTVARNPCKSLDTLSIEDKAYCNKLLRQSKHERVQKKLNAMKKEQLAAPTLPPTPAGYLINAQWDGETFPSVNWGLDITRQKTEFSFNSTDFEKQLINLIPIRPGNASSPTYTTYSPLSRNYYLVTGRDEFSAWMWGAAISSDTSTATSITPRVKFQYLNEGVDMVGLEVVTIDHEIVLVFYADGTVAQVDPATGNMKAYSSTINPNTRQVNCVTQSTDTREIYLLTQNQLGEPQYGIVTFNYATRQSNEVIMQVPQYFVPAQEQGFEMVYMPSLQNLLVFFTGNFDSIMYYDPITGNASLAVFNMAEYQGSIGHIEFTVSTFLEDLDTTANAAIDLVGQQIYFQCSDVDPETDDTNTCLCSHPVPTPSIFGLAWDYINVNIEPMTYGYAAAEFVQIEN